MSISGCSSDVCSSDLTGFGEVFSISCGRRSAANDSANCVQSLPLPRTWYRKRSQDELGRASCRERVGQYVYTKVVADSLKKIQIIMCFFSSLGRRLYGSHYTRLH